MSAQHRLRSISVRAVMLSVAALVSMGCATPPERDCLVLSAADYHRAFDAALEVARERGAMAAIRDRRSGYIETEPVVAPSLSEPWYWSRSTTEHVVRGTLHYERRRARFIFAPRDVPHPAVVSAVISGPDLLGIDDTELDLTTYHGEITLSVMVFLERTHQPGQRRNSWTRKATSQTRIYPTDETDPLPPSQFWQIVSRDPLSERRLLEAVAQVLHRDDSRGDLQDATAVGTVSAGPDVRNGESVETAGG